jgi:hypothetical protein
VPRDTAGRADDPVHEAGWGPRGLDGPEEADGVLESRQLPPALGAGVEVSVERATLLARERVVQPGRELLARLVAAHGKNRRSLSLRSMRARCRRERTVPTGTSSAAAISS